MKSLAGEIELLNGDRTEGAHLHIGYFSQHQLEALDLNASPILQLQRKRPRASEQEIRNFLGGFDFRGSAAEDGIAHFSGGEKARLALALVVWQKPNLLLLDEPTNHLDLDMCHALTAALQEYEGALVLISHDRHLVRNCADSLHLVNGGKVTEFDGDLDDYRDFLLGKTSKGAGKKKDQKTAVEVKAVDPKQQRQEAAALRAKTQPLKKLINNLERKIDKSNDSLKAVEAQLSDSSLYEAGNKAQLDELLAKQQTLKAESEDLEMQWLEAQESLEALGGE